MHSEYSEEDLIRRAQRGEREAFASLYEAHVDRVYHYLLNRVGQPADAEDVTAEVFIRAMRALPSFQIQGAPFIAWLLRIAHNLAVNHLKKQSRRQEIALFESEMSSNDDPADIALQRAAFEEASTAMESLTHLQRQVVQFRFLRQLSIAETAHQMSRSEEAIKFLQHSAIRALRRRFSDKETVNDE